VNFDSLRWKANPLLLSLIHFKPAVYAALAKEAGIEPGVIELIKQIGLTEAELRRRLGIQTRSVGRSTPDDVKNALQGLLGGAPSPTPPIPDPTVEHVGGSRTDRGAASSGTSGARGSLTPRAATSGPSTSDGANGHERSRSPGSKGGRPFASYVGVHLEDDGPDPGGLDHDSRVALEEKGIASF
jgi:hypothetical protein